MMVIEMIVNEIVIHWVVWFLIISIVVTPYSIVLLFPIIRAMLNSMNIVMLISMLWVVLTIIIIGVVVTHVMGSLRLYVVVLSVLFSREVSFVI